MRAVAAGVTDVGRERDHNEDRFVLLPEFEVFVVADGMGGHQYGEVASRLATSTIANYFRARREAGNAESIADVLRASLHEANDRIHRRAASSSSHRGMGTTVVAAALHRQESKFYVAHAGDSRCYRMRANVLAQVTRDHSLIEEALRTRPDISTSELAYLPSNVITRALGVEAQVDVEVTVADVQLGDVFLLCSDGLHGFVSDERIQEIVVSRGVLTDACAELIAEANRNGGGDNITAVLVRIEQVDEPWANRTSLPPAPNRRSAPPVHAAKPARDATTKSRLASPSPTASLAEESSDEGESFGADDTARMPAVTDVDAVLGLDETPRAADLDIEDPPTDPPRVDDSLPVPPSLPPDDD